MQEEWRTQLFRSEPVESPLNHLGFPKSIAEGRRILQICHDTWKRWEELATSIPEYKLLQIKMRNKFSRNGKAAPITPYQIWVIGKIGELYQKMPDGILKEPLVKEYIDAKKDEFTRQSYETEQVRYTTLVLN
ncbi:MAG: hypothetical protein KME52_18430 [Desmonostoc geniculatum HA4340-LM1]|jgi:predicted SAM-dependent methyltransferase|nr:hypothetical protein [Desmonostoc geniculatum HA4340-LM1]